MERPPQGWTVETEDGRPTAWRAPDGQTVRLDGVLPPDGSVRRGLDLALLSPNGHTVCVDENGTYAGTLSRGALLGEEP